MQVIILAAGVGSRLGDLTFDRPKAMVRVAGRELILRVKDFLDHPAIGEKIVVTGYKSDFLSDFLKKNWPEAKTIFNPHYKEGSIRSIETALPLIKGDFLVMNADHIYPRRMLQHIIGRGQGLSAVCDFDRTLGPDDMKVRLCESGKLKFIRKTLDEFDCGYIGMTYCASNELPTYKNCVSQTRKAEGDKAAVEFALGYLATKDHKINICDTSGIGWLEVDTQEDLAKAEETLQNNPGFLL